MTDIKPPYIILFTCDLVLNHILNRLLEKCTLNFSFVIYDSFSDVDNISENENIDLILVDDLIIGTSSFELISFLRANKKTCSPIIYFGINEHGNEKKAITLGANFFVHKPFNPDGMLKLLKPLLSK